MCGNKIWDTPPKAFKDSYFNEDMFETKLCSKCGRDD